MRAEFFHVDGQTDRQTDGETDMTKLIVAFRNFSNAPKKGYFRGGPSGNEPDQYSGYTALT